MREEIVYLDSSVIVKRYVEEPGSTRIRDFYRRAYSGEIILSYSLWNIGEVLGAFDRARRLNRITDEEYRIIKRRFLHETRRMIKLGIMILVPLIFKIMRESWKILEKYHLYLADALQIVSARNVNAKLFITSDEKLHEIALKEGIKSEYIG